MNQYKCRIGLERRLLKKINLKGPKYKLQGLSWGAINNWVMRNGFSSDMEVIKELYLIAQNLVVLANRSQEVVDPSTTADIEDIRHRIDLLEIRQLYKDINVIYP
ncbi:MAG: hypothetical protein ABJC12_07185 [Saprospiraceae bacterium]